MFISSWLMPLLLPRRWDVCGLIVSPLTVWHVYILTAVKNPYLCGGMETIDSAAELMMYVMHGIDDGRKLYMMPNFRKRARNKVVRHLKACKWEEIHAAIQEYVTSCMRVPDHAQVVKPKAGESAGKPIAAPIAWVLAEYMCGGDACKLDNAMDTPFCLACCLYYTKRNVCGDDDLLVSETKEERVERKLGAI